MLDLFYLHQSNTKGLWSFDLSVEILRREAGGIMIAIREFVQILFLDLEEYRRLREKLVDRTKVTIYVAVVTGLVVGFLIGRQLRANRL